MAIDTNALPSHVLTDILESLGCDFTNEKDVLRKTFRVSEMTPEQAFKCWCEWNGLLGDYHAMVRHALDGIRAAEKKDA